MNKNMTNKEKYPDAKIDYNQFVSVGNKIKGGYFIKLKERTYLLYDGTIGGHNHDYPDNTYYKSREEAQQALEKFMNEKNKITLQEIKDQYEKAKALIGKKITRSSLTMVVKTVHLELLNSNSSVFSNEFFERHGYVIQLKGGGSCIPFDSNVEICKQVIVVKAHDGVEYEAKNNGECWKFGCAEISKQLIKKAYELMDTTFDSGNRKLNKITIGACDFDFDTLKKLVEADV